MRRKNVLFYSALTAILLLISAGNTYSQWTLAGAVTSAGTFPSVSVVNQNLVWVAGGTNTPTIWRTTNGGTNWTSIPTNGMTLDVFCVWAIDENTAYVGNGGAAGGAGGNATFYKTTNAGVNWTSAGSTGGSAGFINGIVFSKTNPMFGFAESDPPTGSGQPYWISKTTDGGATWTVSNPPGFPGAASSQNSLVAIDPSFYAWGNNVAPSMIVTTDGGATYNNRPASVIAGTFTSGLAFSDDKMTGLIASSTSLPNVARTTNAGVNWTAVNVGTGVGGYCTIKWITGTNTCYLSSATGASGCVKKSTDGGLTWTTMTTSGLTGITHMEFYRSGTTVYGFAATGSGAILKVTDVVTEVNQINTLTPSEFSLAQNYPNPFNPTTTINFSIPNSSDVSIKVYDALGKEVASLVNEYKNAGNYSVDFTAASNLTSGIYFYTMSAGNFTQTKKLMLVK